MSLMFRLKVSLEQKSSPCWTGVLELIMLSVLLLLVMPLNGEPGGEDEDPPIIRLREPPLNMALMSSHAKTMTSNKKEKWKIMEKCFVERRILEFPSVRPSLFAI